MPYLIVEYEFDPPLSDEALETAFQALAPCLQVRGIRRLRSVLSEDRTHGFCQFEAADAETVREAFRVANVGFRRVWSASLFEFGGITPAAASNA